MPVKIVVSDPKTRKSVQIEKDITPFLNLKIGDTFDGNLIGASGFLLKITGGSDKDGFPMRPDFIGTARKRLLLSSGPGFKPWKKGLRKRKTVHGNTIDNTIAQINCKVIKGEGDIVSLLKPAEKKEESG
ncbi:MAG: 30S ribosomal protein S6e [Candidatus Aenigmatarchaeota archaeon]|nr:30S ribosomal protein S6e [Candidatus Aenigmarchaeota archaeon]